MGLLGAAVYDQSQTTVRLLRDVGEDHEFTVLQECMVYTGAKESPPKDSFVKESCVSTDPNANSDKGTGNVNASFATTKAATEKRWSDSVKQAKLNDAGNFESAFQRITELFAEECLNDAENQLVSRFRIDTSSRNMVRALGALLKYMDASRIGVEYEPLNVRTPVTAVRIITVGELLEIDDGTYLALDIFTEHEMKDCNLDITRSIRSLLGSITDVKYILNRLRSGTAKVKHWENLFKTISNSVTIGQYLESLSSPLTLLHNDIGNFGDVLAETMVVLDTMIDFEESYIENRLVVKIGVDPELDKTKQLYRQLPGILTRVAEEECRRLKANTCSVSYYSPAFFQSSISLEVIYTTETTMNAKSKRMRELDEELGDVKMKIIDKETTINCIFCMMSSMLLSRSSMLLGIQRANALLDAAIALTLTARNSGGNYSKVKVLTGPNACGKSVYLKQVGLLVYLAHIGSFVPAEVAHMGIVDRIVSRVHTLDSVLDGMSTFAKDLKLISIALRRGSGRSLVIIDEFGKGTMTEVGLSLLASSLSYWVTKGQSGCPHVFVSSHFHALTKLITDHGSILSHHTFEVLRRGIELDFQFRLVEGVVESSFAAYMARKMGVLTDVANRANEVYEHVRDGHPLNAIVFDYEEEQNNSRWLKQRTEFLTWDLESDPYGLLEVVEKIFVGPYNADENIYSCTEDQEDWDMSCQKSYAHTQLVVQRSPESQSSSQKGAMGLDTSMTSLSNAHRSDKRADRCFVVAESGDGGFEESTNAVFEEGSSHDSNNIVSVPLKRAMIGLSSEEVHVLQKPSRSL
ncbi:MutS domain V protein [Dictyocaulus viviparus]|uniref:MutS domain V protein n=1 Tax=Dictyocaulus viviparus TaxID=29172 RepID=A0A0D8X8I4_DICVI|nr:MutS domain V protein [Dictyocaulus viviparus]